MDLRNAVLREAESWLHTPFHHEARLKGIGVDCLMLLAEVYEKAGVIPHVEVEHYPADWYMHRDQEKYLGGVLRYAREVEIPSPADVVVFHMGRVFSHGGIVFEWPKLIHAHWRNGVVWGDAERDFDLKWEILSGEPRPRERRFFSPFMN